MEYTKEQARLFETGEYKYCGYWNNLYHFQKGDYRKGFVSVSCSSEDMKNGDIDWMFEKERTRAK